MPNPPTFLSAYLSQSNRTCSIFLGRLSADIVNAALWLVEHFADIVGQYKYCHCVIKIWPTFLSADTKSLTVSLAFDRLRISGNPAGLSHVNGVHHSSVKTGNSTLCQSHNFISIDFTFGMGDMLRRSPALPNLVQIQWAVETSLGQHVFCDFFIIQHSYSHYQWTDFRAQ